MKEPWDFSFIFSEIFWLYKKNVLSLHPQTEKGAIAQLVEQRTENPCVPGSIPGGTTFLRKKYRNVAQLVAHYVRDVGVGRSSRLIPTIKRQTSKIDCRFFFSTFANR